jgi:hypothetical protein
LKLPAPAFIIRVPRFNRGLSRMTTKPVARLLLSGDIERLKPATPRSADPVAETALALVVELMRALRDRGLLSRPELDDLLGEVGHKLKRGDDLSVVDLVRMELEREFES